VFYNLTITGLSVFVAFFIGTIEVTAQDRNLVPQHQNLRVLRDVVPREECEPAEQTGS
jgi:high-affinity nickel permease